MSEFETFAVVLSFVLGLGVAQILSSVVFILQSRREISFAWTPLMWAFSLLLYHVNYLFSLLWMQSVTGEMIWYLDVLMVVLLFLGGGLVLPSESRQLPGDLGEFFLDNGYVALVPLGLFIVLHLVYSYAVGLGILTLDGATNAFLLATIAVGYFARRRAGFAASLVFTAVALFAFLFLWSRPGAL